MRNFIHVYSHAFRLLALTAVSIGVLAVTACGGGGGYGGGGGNVPLTGPGPSKAFAADSGHRAIGSLANPNPGAGPIAIDRTIIGPVYTQLSNNIGSLALDPALDYLYVGNGPSILVFNGASQANGDIPPSRIISSSPGFGNTGSMFLDTTHDVLYVGDDPAGVRVFNGISALASGSHTNDRLVNNLGTAFTVRGVAVDTTVKDILYVSNDVTSPTSSHRISVFDGASTVTTAAPNRTITPMDVTLTLNFTVGGIALDATRDLLYVGGGTVRFGVMVFTNASSKDGPTVPDKVFNISGVITKVWVDSASDRLYALNSDFIYIIENASTALGSVAAKAVVAPALGNFTAIAVAP